VSEDRIKLDITKLKCKKCEFTFTVSGNDAKGGISGSAETVGKSVNGDEAKWIEDAMRLAEVIISDIHIYNKDKVGHCKTDQELALALSAELKKGRNYFLEKINPNLKDPNSYYAKAVRKFLKIKKED